MYPGYEASVGVVSVIANALSRKNIEIFVQPPPRPNGTMEVMQGGVRIFSFAEPDRPFYPLDFSDYYWSCVDPETHFFGNLQAAELSLDLWLRHVSADVRRNIVYPISFHWLDQL
jgi:hypothetical protein